MTRVGTLLAAVVVLALGACGSDDDSGPDAAPVIAAVTVSGVVRYEDRVPQLDGTLSAQRTPMPARAVSVSLIAMDGTTLVSGVTADDGSYTLTAPAVLHGSNVHILAATMSTAATRPIEVVRTNNLVHGFRAPDFVAVPTATVDVLVTETSGEAGAFNIFDVLIDSADYVTSLGATSQPVTAVWQRNNTDGTYYDFSSNTMYLLGESSDDDGYDDQVILHEAGHYIEDAIGRSDSPGGFHDGSPTDPRLAWSEGFATYWAMAVTNAPFYIDTAQGGGWSFNAESSVTPAPMPAGPMSQRIGEDTINEVLWDLGDAPGTDDDAIAGPHVAVASVQIDYLRVATLRAGAGVTGVDLVDFLDGFFMADGLTRCAGVRGIVITDHTFPYDFAGPAGACP